MKRWGMAPPNVPLKVHWFLPTGGDSRDVLPAADGNRRAPDLDYLAQVARAAVANQASSHIVPHGVSEADG